MVIDSSATRYGHRMVESKLHVTTGQKLSAFAWTEDIRWSRQAERVRRNGYNAGYIHDAEPAHLQNQ